MFSFQIRTIAILCHCLLITPPNILPGVVEFLFLAIAVINSYNQQWYYCDFKVVYKLDHRTRIIW